MSAVALERVEGLTLYVRGLDIVDGSPVLDIKPYVPYADIVTSAESGWLGERPDLARDVGPQYEVAWNDRALRQEDWLRRHGVALRAEAEQQLSLGPTPHAYRRIKREGDHFRLALRDFRLLFTLHDRTVTIIEVLTGYGKKQLEDARSVPKGDTPLDVHRAFVAKFR
jgi:mRNA-degrading endonuclease RelE of RelBE toxin-antitoxin system